MQYAIHLSVMTFTLGNKWTIVSLTTSKFYRERQRFDDVSWSSSGRNADAMATQNILNPRINYFT